MLEMGYRDTIEEFLEVMTGKAFVKSAIYDNISKTLLLSFYETYEDYVSDKEDQRVIDKKQYGNYFGTFNKIEKLVVLESARLLRDFININTVSMSLTFEGVHYDANVDRRTLNNLIGYDIRKLKPQDGTWKTEFSDVYGYGINNEKRSFLFNNFVNKSG